jgi:hypothetical protein
MTAMLTIEGRIFGRKRPLFDDFTIPLPPEWEDGGETRGEPLTLRGLITRIVQEEVRAFNERQEARRLTQALTQADIERGLMRGKVDMGGHSAPHRATAEAAVGAALLAFEDGLYYVFVDDEQQTNLDREVYVRPDSRVMFLRLVALAGG